MRVLVPLMFASLLINACDSPGGGTWDAGAPSLPPSGLRAYLPGRVSVITMDDVAFYFACDDRSIYRLTKVGSDPAQKIADGGHPFVDGIAVDDANVYWTDLQDGVDGGVIFRVAKTGGIPVPLATGQPRPWGIAVDDANVYWANQGMDLAGQPFGGGQIVSLPKTGGSPVVLVDNLQLSSDIVLDPDGVIWHDLSTIRRVPKTGGAVTTLDSRSGGFFIRNLVVSGGQLYYWAGQSSGSFIRVPTTANDTAPPSDGPFGTVLGQGDYPAAIAIDGDGLFWIEQQGNTVAQVTRISLTDGSQSIVVPPDLQTAPSGLEIDSADALLVDAQNIYSIEFWAPVEGMSTSVLRALPR